MEFLATLFVFSALSAAANTQVVLNTSSLVSYNATILEGGPNGGCPALEDRQAARNTINQTSTRSLEVLMFGPLVFKRFYALLNVF